MCSLFSALSCSCSAPPEPLLTSPARLLRPRRRHHRSPAQPTPERIRLSGIDCPEKGQAYGKRAKQAASELVFGKEVTLQTHGHDKYWTHPCRCASARWNSRQSHAGQRRLVLVVSEYAPGNTVLEGLEKEAREAKKGLWVDQSNAAVGVAEEKPLSEPIEWTQ